MFRVPSVALRLMLLATGTSVQIDKAIVITSCDAGLILTHIDDVYVGAVRACRIDALDEPPKLNGMVRPCG